MTQEHEGAATQAPTHTDPIRLARERIATTAAELAAAVASARDANEFARLDSLKSAADVVKTLAEAAGAVTGPQGGQMTYRYRSNVSTVTDSHETRHAGDERERPAGFTSPPRPITPDPGIRQA